MENKVNRSSTANAPVYFHGDAGEYTGEKQIVGGVYFYQFRLVEGHKAGDLKWTQKAPHLRYCGHETTRDSRQNYCPTCAAATDN